MGDSGDATQRPKRKEIEQATNPRYATAKITVRGIIIVLSLAATITSLVSVSAPKRWDSWIIRLMPVYGLPYPLLSLAWELSEIAVLLVRRHKNKGLDPSAHLACELLLLLGGVVVGALWVTDTAATQQYSGSFTEGGGGISAATYNKWASVIYFWCALNFATVVCQFFLFVVSCIEVDQKRRNMERKVNEVLAIIQERGQNANDVLAALRSPPPDYDSTKPSWPAEMPAVNQQPVEMSVDERPIEVTGSQVGHEMPVLGTDDVSGNQKFVLKP
ncbi:hypothetical protein KVR01_002306 [Diaporthe batatas]|uniref:uncharacterized protein n=1 Tax=Diaporthe batatas TaxID=748121 RepID=UPI001D047925|nr:uncharacterized protein KVR01_002306 [Diaporthe batatas]KAG8166617.1 hypothetical protein KVR01_002306 [Diaporthe batatas]